jgi:DNA-binding transcriptional LysR family regulator
MGALLIPAVKQVGADGPATTFRLRSGATRSLLERLGRDIDAVLGLSLGDTAGGRAIARSPLVWIGDSAADGPVPLLVYPEGCLMRTQAMAALDRAGIDWSVAVEVGGAGAIVAAAQAGLGIGILPEACLPRGVARAASLPPLPEIEIRLWTAGPAHDDALAKVAESVSRILG